MTGREFFLVASTAAICSLVAYLVRTPTATPEVLRSESSAAHGNHATSVSNPDDWPVKLDAGEQGVDAAAASQQDSSQRDGENHSDKSRAQDPAVVLQERQELGERFSRLLTSGSNPGSGAIGARIENRFYSEEWNQEWAGSKEENIRDLFDANEDLSGMAPLQVTCRSKNCQVVISASGQDQVRLVSEKFMRAATRGDVGMKDKVVSFFPDASMKRVVFYLSENGNMDLFD